MSELITIITPTTGADCLKRNLQSVQNQSYKQIQHLVFIDGKQALPKVQDLISDMELKNVDFIPLPYSTGHSNWNGHRMYMAGIALASDQSNYISFLDEDNYLEENHIEELYKTIKEGNEWSFSFRRIVDEEGNFICNDDCESLGLWPSILNEQDYFVDLNCYMIKRPILLQLAQLFYRKARDPNMQPEIDRAISYTLKGNNVPGGASYQYSVNYKVGNRSDSVQKEFFINGNQAMLEKYQDK